MAQGAHNTCEQAALGVDSGLAGCTPISCELEQIDEFVQLQESGQNIRAEINCCSHSLGLDQESLSTSSSLPASPPLIQGP
eukprot:706011-Rhodomonas_salina.1